MDEIRAAANDIVTAVTMRERTDVRLPPMMVAFIVLSYIAVLLYYASTLYGSYDTVPLPQLFTLAALFTIGAGLLIAIFYLLINRDSNHSAREANLRTAMIRYAESMNVVCGADLINGIQRMKETDEMIRSNEKSGKGGLHLMLILVPIAVGLTIMVLTGDTDRFTDIVCWSYGASLALAVLMTPSIITFPRRHEAAALGFFDAWCGIAPSLGLSDEKMKVTIGCRSFWASLILTVATVGIFALFWLYALFDDMNRHFDEQWYFEDTLLKGIRDKENNFRRDGVPRGVNYVLEDNWVK